MFRVFQEEKIVTVFMLSFLLISVFLRIVLGMLYQNMIKESDNMAATENKMLKQCKLKFANCYQMNNGVANIPICRNLVSSFGTGYASVGGGCGSGRLPEHYGRTDIRRYSPFLYCQLFRVIFVFFRFHCGGREEEKEDFESESGRLSGKSSFSAD